MTKSRFYKIKAVLNDISDFGKHKFLKNLSESKLKIKVRDCTQLEDEEVDSLIEELVDTNLDPETGV